MKLVNGIQLIQCELCFNVALNDTLTNEEHELLSWLLSRNSDMTYGTSDNLSMTSSLPRNKVKENMAVVVIEVGPRMNFSTAWSSNVISICKSIGINKITRIERSRRYYIEFQNDINNQNNNNLNLIKNDEKFTSLLYDRMTEEIYKEPLKSFKINNDIILKTTVKRIPILKEGRKALVEINEEMGLAFDDWDLNYYTDLFLKDFKRDPTNVELFDIAQSNSEHCRYSNAIHYN